MLFNSRRYIGRSSEETIRAPLQALTAAEWLSQEQDRLLGRVLFWLGRMLAAGLIIMLALAILMPFAWQRWLTVILLGVSIVLQRLLVILHRREQVFTSSILTIGMVIAIGLVVGLLFKDMQIPFVVLGVMLVSLTTSLIGARAGFRLMLVLTGLEIFLVGYIAQFQSSQLEVQHAGPFNANMVIYLAAMLLAILLIKLKDDSVHRTLDQWMFKSRQLEAANTRLQQAMAERARVEEQRLALAVEQERVRILTDFVRDASHEFRTPLSVINAHLYLLDRTIPADLDRVRLGVIRDQTAYLDHLIEALMEMTRLDSGLTLELADLRVNLLVRSVLSAYQPAASQKQIALQFHPDEALPPIQGDRQRLELAISHLIQNALDFSAPGDTVEVTTLQAGDQVQIAVRDTGMGITPEVLPHIFERFYRGDQSRSTRAVGLGLPMALKIAEAHEGTIEVESVSGQGSIFRLILPAEARQVPLTA
jgi:signal transduction histidine kinase